jgi:molybdopterin-containing oxidoreductase family membrane subunit
MKTGAKKVPFVELDGTSVGYYALLGILAALVLAGLGASYYVEHHGHIVTGMNNVVVWGVPHVFAVFLIVAASGALNVASVSSVFARVPYKPLAPLSGLLAIALLIGGLAVLVLDLGRPDRLIVAMTTYNFKSIFSWNIYLYTGFIAVVAVYLWMLMDRRMASYSKPAGVTAFVWRIILTTGTGSIFGFLVARDAYDAAILAPTFVALSLAYGTAVFLLVLMATYRWADRPLGDAILLRLKGLLGVFVAAGLYFVAVYHLTNLYFTERHGFERYILLEGGAFTVAFWLGQVLIGSIVPMALLWHPRLGRTRPIIGLASVLVILGGLAQMYVTIPGGQAYPLEIFPGREILSSTLADGQVVAYHPTAPEFILGIGGFGLALLLVALAVRVLRFLPATLADAAIDPHHRAEAARAAA